MRATQRALLLVLLALGITLAPPLPSSSATLGTTAATVLDHAAVPTGRVERARAHEPSPSQPLALAVLPSGLHLLRVPVSGARSATPAAPGHRQEWSRPGRGPPGS